MDWVIFFLLIGGGDLVADLIKANHPTHAVALAVALVVGGLTYFIITRDADADDDPNYVSIKRRTVEKLIDSAVVPDQPVAAAHPPFYYSPGTVVNTGYLNDLKEEFEEQTEDNG